MESGAEPLNLRRLSTPARLSPSRPAGAPGGTYNAMSWRPFFSAAFRFGGITKATGKRYFTMKLEHFLDHKSLQFLWKML